MKFLSLKMAYISIFMRFTNICFEWKTSEISIMKIEIRDIQGANFSIDFPEGSTVADMKKTLTEQQGYHTETSLVFYKGNPLADDTVLTEGENCYALVNKDIFPERSFAKSDNAFHYDDSIRYKLYYNKRTFAKEPRPQNQGRNHPNRSPYAQFILGQELYIHQQDSNEYEEDDTEEETSIFDENVNPHDFSNVIDASTFHYDEREERRANEERPVVTPIREEDIQVDVPPEHQQVIDNLINRGFERMLAVQVAAICNYNEEDSVNLMLAMQE